MKTFKAFFFFYLMGLSLAFGQDSVVEGYVYESDNRGFLNAVKIECYNSAGDLVSTTSSNREGYFSIKLSSDDDLEFNVVAKKFNYKTEELPVRIEERGQKIFLKVMMVRESGYLFDVTIASKRPDPTVIVDAIKDARVEVFNNTLDREELVINKLSEPNFEFMFKKGNHYTVMIRKDGFLTKRMEAYVNVDDCILCFDGIGKIEPKVNDNLTEYNTAGVLLTNVELEPVAVGSKFVVENIYYDFNKFQIRRDAAKELDKLITVLDDNPKLIVELGSHTDSRGDDDYNMELSQARATSAVNYLINKGGIDKNRISAKGYGESELVNHCTNDVECKDELHQKNRRTELKVVGLTKLEEEARKSLAEIIREERFYQNILSKSEVVEVTGDSDEIPADLQAYINAQKAQEDGSLEAVKIAVDLPSLSENYRGYSILLTTDRSIFNEIQPLISDEDFLIYKESLVEYFLLGTYNRLVNVKKKLKQIKKEHTILEKAKIVLFRNGKMIK